MSPPKTGSQLNGAELSLYGGSYDTFNPSLQLGGTTGNLDYFVDRLLPARQPGN